MTPLPKRRHSSRRSAKRERANMNKIFSGTSICSKCKAEKLPHRACSKCGSLK